MIFFRKDYQTREFFIDGNDLMVRGTDQSIDFRDEATDEGINVSWYRVNNDKREQLIKMGDTKSKRLEKTYQSSLKNKKE